MVMLVTIVAILVFPLTVGGSELDVKMTSTGLRYSAEKKICMTSICVENASYMRMIMNQSVNPCNDFYQYACGNWSSTNPMPDDESVWGNLEMVYAKVLDQIKEVLERNDTCDISSARSKARVFYSACLDVEHIEHMGTTPLTTLLESTIGGWPVLTKNWNAANFSYYQVLKWGMDLGMYHFLQFGVNTDFENPTENIITFSESSLGMGAMEYYFDKDFDTMRIAYKNMMRKVITLLNNSSANASVAISKDVDSIYEFEAHIASLTTSAEDSRNFSLLVNKMTLEEFHKTCLSRTMTLKQLTDYLVGAMPTIALKELVKPTMIVDIQNPDYFVQVHNLLAEKAANSTHLRLLANYIGWRAALWVKSVMPKKYRALAEAYDQVADGRAKNPERWKACANLVNSYMGTAVGSLYVSTYFNHSNKIKVAALVTDIRRSFSTILKSADWMDESTRTKAQQKLDSMMEYIAYPDYLVDNITKLDIEYENLDVGMHPIQNLDQISRFTIETNLNKLLKKNERSADDYVKPATAGASYFPTMNVIAFLAGLLQKPYYEVDRPEFLNYASFGYVIGHEVTHGFDDQGSQFDGSGKFGDWWSQTSRAHFKEEADGFVNLYSNYSVPEGHVNGYLTLGENIADSGGYKTALNAYQAYLNRTGVSDKLLPGFETSTIDQLFFLSLAQNWCGVTRSESVKDSLLTNPHSPFPVRVLGPLSNMPEFSKAYQCPLGSTMNPRTKYSVW